MAVSQTGVDLTSAVYCDDTDTYRTQYDQATTTASMAVVTTVSQVLGTAPTDMAPLQHSVDTGALDALTRGRTGCGTARTTFAFEGCEVTVSSEGVVTVAPQAGDGTDPAVQGEDPDGPESR